MKRTFLTLALLAQVVAVPAMAASQNVTALSYEDRTACAALFGVRYRHQVQHNDESVAVFYYQQDYAKAVRNAVTVGRSLGLTDDAVYDNIDAKQAQLRSQSLNVSYGLERVEFIEGYGPGLQACLAGL